MKLRTRPHSLPGPGGPSPAAVGAGGFSMVELMIVVGLIVVMAAVALPNIAGYLRQAKVRGAMQQVAGEMQTARNKAIVKNTNAGVAFAVLDADTYRFYVGDDDTPALPLGTALGPIHQLPGGVTFVPAALPGFVFDRLGRACQYGAGCPMAAQPAPARLCPTGAELARCQDNAPGNYVSLQGGSFVVEVIENTTQLRRRVEVAPGGRVVTQR
jgi:type II secretory pathway pseudopilin PulG